MSGGRHSVKIPYRYIHRDVDRHGNARIYFQRPYGRKTRLRAAPGSEAFEAEYRAALDAPEAPPSRSAPARGPAQGTLHWLCVQYFRSAEFARLDAQSRRVRRGILEACLREPVAPDSDTCFAAFPLPRLTPKAVRVLRDRKATTPSAANNRLKALRRLFAFAVESELMALNPARDVPKFPAATDGHHTWTMAEVRQFEARHEPGSQARLALALFLYTGQRRSDVARLGRQHVKNGWLSFTQAKNRARRPVTVEIPVPPELARAIEEGPTGDLTFLVTHFGKPFTAAGLGNKMREWCNAAGLRHCSAHGLRKTAATLFAEKGATEYQLMAWFGWLTPAQASHYVRKARRRQLTGTMAPLMRRNAEET